MIMCRCNVEWPRCNVEYSSGKFIHSKGSIECLWSLVESINKSSYKIKNNIPDLIIWNSEVKIVKWQDLVVQQASMFQIKFLERRTYTDL